MPVFGLLICVLLSIADAASQSWSNAVDGTCKFTVNHDLDIRFEQNPLLFIDRLHTNDLSSCRQLCCDHKTCNGYVWSGEDLNKEQCKLLKCPNEGTDCKNALTKNILGKTKHEVGFITGIADPQNPLDAVLGTSSPRSTTSTTKIKAASMNISIVTTASTLPPVVAVSPKTSSARKGVEPTTTTAPVIPVISTTTKTTPKLISTHTNIPIVEIGGEEDQQTVQEILKKNTTHKGTGTHTEKNKTLPHTVSVKSNDRKLRLKASNSNSTKKGVIPRNNYNGHSDYISLTVALLFGLAFLVMTLFFVGKRWVESIRESHHRTGYTRISYLLNGV